MPVQNTILMEHDTREGTSKFGPWTLHLFTDVNAQVFKTFKDNIADDALTLMNQPVTIHYSVKANGKYQDLEIDSVAVSNGDVTAQPHPEASHAVKEQYENNKAEKAREQELKELRIHRQSGMYAALKMFDIANVNPFEEWELLIETATRLQEWYSSPPEDVVE